MANACADASGSRCSPIAASLIEKHLRLHIGADPQRRHIAVAPSRREALDGLIEYLNFMMDEEVPPSGSEAEIYRAVEDNLYAQTEIVECAFDGRVSIPG